MSPTKTKKRKPLEKSPAKRSGTVRRSFALPAKLIEQVSEAAPPQYRGNLNAAVRIALEEHVKRKRDDAFERRMDAMAADPWIRQVNAEIFRENEAHEGEEIPPA